MDVKTKLGSVGEESQDNYSLDMVDTIFADTLSRGMQNAIVSQQNAQMASSSSVTHACARILQAQPKPDVTIELESNDTTPFELKQNSIKAPKSKTLNRFRYWIIGGVLLLMCAAGAAWLQSQGINSV